MNANQAVSLIERLVARPNEWRVSTNYENGAAHIFDTATEAQAETYATRQRRKIGKVLISRETGKTVRVVSVDVAKI